MIKTLLLPAFALATLLSTSARAADPVPAAAAAPAPAAAAAPAAAPAAAGQPAWLVACGADLTKHCQTEMKANADARPCLAKHEADLSQQCKDVFLNKYKILETCKEDIATVCGGTTDGRELGKCFNEKQDKLSDKCKLALRRGSAQQKKETAAAAAAPEAGKDAKVAAKPAKAGKLKKASATKPAK